MKCTAILQLSYGSVQREVGRQSARGLEIKVKERDPVPVPLVSTRIVEEVLAFPRIPVRQYSLQRHHHRCVFRRVRSQKVAQEDQLVIAWKTVEGGMGGLHGLRSMAVSGHVRPMPERAIDLQGERERRRQAVTAG